METIGTNPSPAVSGIIIPHPFEILVNDSAEIQAGSEYALVDWNLKRASFGSFVGSQLKELCAETVEDPRRLIEDPGLAEEEETRAKKAFEEETGIKVSKPANARRIPLAPPYSDLDPEMVINLAGQQLADFADMIFSKSSFEKQIENNKNAPKCEILNRYQLTIDAKSPLKNNALMYRTIIVRSLDAIRLLRERGVRRFEDSIEKALDQLILRDLRVIKTKRFEASTCSWHSSDLEWIVQNLGHFVLATLRTGKVPKKLGQAALSWIDYLPTSLAIDALRINDRKALIDQMKDTPKFKKARTVFEYREFAIKLIIAMSDDSYSGFGHYSKSIASPTRPGRKEEFLARSKTGMRRHYDNLVAALEDDSDETLRKKLTCNEIQTIDSVIKSWEDHGIRAER